MFEDTLELAENKLLLLYIFDKINIPVSNNQITDIVLENNFINYFTLQQYISELISANFIKSISSNEKHKLQITKKGKKVLSLFINRVNSSKLSIVNEYLNKQINNIKREVTITSNYTVEPENKFVVNLKAVEDDTTLIDIKLTVDSNEQAHNLCSKWEKSSPDIYDTILNILLD